MIEFIDKLLLTGIPILLFSGIFDFFPDIFKGSKSELPPPRAIEQPYQIEMRQLLEKYAKGGGEYRGRQRGILEGYLADEGLPGLARTEAERTLGDYYEPYAGRYYEPFREKALSELAEAKTRLGRSAQIAGMYETTPRIGIEGKLEEATLSNLMSEIGRIYEAERGRKTAMVPYAEQAPLRKMEAIRGYEEAPLQYAMQLLSGYQPRLEYPEYAYEPSKFEKGLSLADKISRILGPIVAAATAPATGGASLAAIPAMYASGGSPGSRLSDISKYYPY